MFRPSSPNNYRPNIGCSNTNYQPFSQFNPQRYGPPQRHGPPHRHQMMVHHNQESSQFWCETCDRGFHAEHLLENHKKQHEKCNIDGCQFIAHPKVITKHIQMQHSTGLYSKISKLQDPEEIQKWREERKKKFPTKANIERRNAELKEKIDRGEKMGINQQRHCKKDFGSRSNPNFEKPRRNYNRNVERNLNKKSNKRKLPELICNNDEKRGLKPFAGIAQLMHNDADNNDEVVDIKFHIDDEDWFDSTQNVEKKDGSNKLCGALSNLISNYVSSDEEATETVGKNIPKPAFVNIESKFDIKVNSSHNTNSTSKNTKNSDDSGPEEQTIVKEIIDNGDAEKDKSIHEQQRNKNPKRNQSRKPITKPTFRRHVPSTLLQKLLNREIKHERNVVLQCIHHIIKLNYFEHNLK